MSLDGFTWVLIPPTIPLGLTRESASILVLGLIKCLNCHFPLSSQAAFLRGESGKAQPAALKQRRPEAQAGA